MAKRTLTITKFDGGLNCFSDSRDIKDTEFFQNWNAVVDKSGIIRMSGEGHLYIEGLPHAQLHSENMQPGYGLFSFSTDYSLSQINSSFDTGIESGTCASAATGATSIILATNPTNVSSSNYATDDFFNNRTIFFYTEGSGGAAQRENKGTRYIEDYAVSGTTHTITVNAKITVTTSTKYIIYAWVPNSSFGTDALLGYYSDNSESPTNDFNAASISSNVITTASNHGYQHFEKVIYSKNSNTTVAGLSDGHIYYIYRVDADEVRLY